VQFDLSFKNYHLIQEALPLSVAKKYTSKKFDKENTPLTYKNPLINHLFDQYGSNTLKKTSKDRIYIPNIVLEVPREISPWTHPIYSNVHILLKVFGFMVLDYINGVATDYHHKQFFKIGRLLNKIANKELTPKKITKKDINDYSKEAIELLSAFMKDPIREYKGVKENYAIVISRSPYDIAGMSTDRHWTSCMNLGIRGINYPKNEPNDAVETTFIDEDIQRGTLIAYLVGIDDLDIKRPVSRVLIKPYISQDTKNTFIYLVSSKIYGLQFHQFREILQKWFDTHFNEKIKSTGIFEIDPELYKDEDIGEIYKINGEELKKYIGYKIKDPKMEEYIAKYIDLTTLRERGTLFKFLHSELAKHLLTHCSIATYDNAHPPLIIDNDKIIFNYCFFDNCRIDTKDIDSLNILYPHLYLNACSIRNNSKLHILIGEEQKLNIKFCTIKNVKIYVDSKNYNTNYTDLRQTVIDDLKKNNNNVLWSTVEFFNSFEKPI
jgi:hypothetical protein